MAHLTKEQQLEELEDALHSLLKGSVTVQVQYEGRRVQYSNTNIDELRKQISMLKMEIAGETRRPFGVLW